MFAYIGKIIINDSSKVKNILKCQGDNFQYFLSNSDGKQGKMLEIEGFDVKAQILEARIEEFQG